ncbi:DUF6089 family protein [Pedobacter sp. P351]|uniref:type IX secretion system protein PorG n=1 Tax=Pedobacter superstes TaxID=3133441 RepID=UPI0030A48630
MNIKFSALLPVFVLFLLSKSSAQTWDVGGFAGTAGYMGDLNPVKPYEINNIAFGGYIKRNFDGYWALKLNAAHGKIEAYDSDSKNAHFKSRNLSFFSPVNELSLLTEFNFFNYIPSVSRKAYTPYLFAGVGFVMFNPKTVYNDEVYELNAYRTEGQDVNKPYKKNALTVPIGAGIKFNFSGKWTLGGELGYRTAYTDYLDDVSGNYASDSQLAMGDVTSTDLRRNLADRSPEVGFPRHSAGTQRGDYRKHDTYLFLGITISYTIFNEKCPVVDY